MNCGDPEFIENYVQKNLPERQMVRFKEHLQNCEDCNERVNEAFDNEAVLDELYSYGTKDSFLLSSLTNDIKKISTIEEAQALLGDQYKVIKNVGGGASGEVFLAIDIRLERSVAVKFLNKKARIQDSQKDRWNEARLMSQLNHPNIAQIFQIGEQDKVQYIIMEWVEGVSLTEAWKEMSLQNRLGLYLKLIEAIDTAHRRNIVHRDIKPSNIMVTAGCKVKVLDFGIAIGIDSLWGSKTKVYRGTPAYSAPEQISSPSEISPATDVFALGILMYQLLTDALPFPQNDPQELFEAIRTFHPELPTAVQESVPIPLQNICLKALEKNPNKRYSDAQALAADIKRYLKGEKVWSRPSFLTDKIQQEVFYHNQRLSVWRDNELLTEREHDKLTNIYDKVIAPSDPSIIESRKLSFSQVCLYLGGWIIVIGSAVLLTDTWGHIPKFVRPIPSVLAVSFMLTCGRFLWFRKENRLSVGFLATGNLLLPVAFLITLGHWQILGPEKFPLGTESIGTLRGSGISIGNCQLLISTSAWLVCSLFFLRIIRSSIFVIFSILAFFAVLTTVYLIGDLRAWDPDIIAFRYLFPGIGIYILGMVLDRKKYIKYAWPLCAAGLITMVLSLSFIAQYEAGLFTRIAPSNGESDIVLAWYQKICIFFYEGEHDARLLSFSFNGLLYLALAWLCRKQGTRLQRTLAQVLNWLGPMHILFTLRVLDEEVTSNIRQLIYRILLPLASFAFVFGSVARQMKSFFFSGLLGIAAAIQKITDEYFKTYFSWPIALILTGVLCMLFSWWIPHFKADQALKSNK